MEALRRICIRRRATWRCAAKQAKRLFSLDELADEPDGRLLAEEVSGQGAQPQSCMSAWTEMNPDYREALYLTILRA